MIKPIKILIAAAEVTPIAKVGGLGDVIGALPKALKKLGVDIKVIIPFHGIIDRKSYKIKALKKNIAVTTAVFNEKINLYSAPLPETDIPVYLIEHKFFNGKDVYASEFKNDNKIFPADLADIEKFVFFSHASLEAVRAIGFRPDVIHLNDWHTAAIAIFLKTIYKSGGFFRFTKTLYTIHNLANQGITDPKIIKLNDINQDLETITDDIKNGDVNFMAQGILNADLVNTVSPTYAKEILTPAFSAGLNKVLKIRKKDLSGIINGLDVDAYNPETDTYIYKNYDLNSLDVKKINKIYLQKKLGLPVNENIPLIGLVSRLFWQKGLDLITDRFSKLPCQFIFLGAGEKKYEKKLKVLAKEYPKNFRAEIAFDERLARQIYAGSDIFLMPSRFEPCGLGQMIAMRYGTVPLVFATGGLKDTVKNYELRITNYELKRANGFSFNKFNPNELFKTLQSALTVYYQPQKNWRQLQINGMKEDFSWNKSAKEYLKLYKKLLN